MKKTTGAVLAIMCAAALFILVSGMPAFANTGQNGSNKTIAAPEKTNVKAIVLSGNEEGSISQFEKDLYFGLRNSSGVENLQQFLTDQGYYAGPITGNYLGLTLQAVRKFQAAQNVLSSGYFGKLSRNAANGALNTIIKEICPDGVNCSPKILPKQQLKITTDSDLHGKPGEFFAATFKVSGGNGNYKINGNGNIPGLSFSQSYCPPVQPGQVEMPCIQMISPSTITLSGIPTAVGVYTVNIFAKEMGGIMYCLDNKSVLDSASATSASPAKGCVSSNSLIRYANARFSVVISPDSGNGSAPVISGVSGPTSLKIGEEGMWTVNASNADGGSLSYRVMWGDEPQITKAQGGYAPEALQKFIQTATFSHSYQLPGKYSPVFYVVNGNGLETKTSLSVLVGKGTAVSSISLMYPKGGEVWQTGETHPIQWKSYTPPLPVGMMMPTYQNQVRISVLQQIYCITTPCNDVETVLTTVPDTGSYDWQIPNSFGVALYRMKVVLLDYNGTEIGSSKTGSYFRVVTLSPQPYPAATSSGQ
ncbi:MAG: peptidoglycan-binding domain-containing protein [Candidatus Liptonbacteria bacterium]